MSPKVFLQPSPDIAMLLAFFGCASSPSPALSGHVDIEWELCIHLGWMKFLLGAVQQLEGTTIRECLTAIWAKGCRSESVQNLWQSQRVTCNYTCRTHLPWNQL